MNSTKIKKFSKSYSEIITPEGWVKNNKTLLSRSNTLADLYKNQTQRTNCKICKSKLPEKAEFKTRGIDYKICNKCTHLNGAHEDTDNYAQNLYESNNPETYGKNYISATQESHQKRVNSIYKPKAEFLISSLKSENKKIENLQFLDIGAGAGHFLVALEAQGAIAPQGIEVSEILVESAKEQLKSTPCSAKIQKTKINEISKWIKQIRPEVITMIGVLEHLSKPHEILDSFAATKECNYLFLSIPMFSPSVCIEAAFPEVYPRHLEGGHTHLFTEKSINWLAEHYGLEKIAEWWFGGDIADLFRSILITLREKKDTENLSKYLEEWLPTETLDKMQTAIDLNQHSSELHILLKKQAAK